jgi:hypothetical protein
VKKEFMPKKLKEIPTLNNENAEREFWSAVSLPPLLLSRLNYLG